MNAENNSCLFAMKGHFPESRNNFSDFPAIIQDTQVCMCFFLCKTADYTTCKSDTDDYENRGGK